MNGLITIAFGGEYDKIAAFTMRHSRKFTDLPIHVITNLLEGDRHSVWGEVSNVTFDVCANMKPRDNRFCKMGLPYYSVFEKSIYIDADAVIQKPGIKCIFDMLDHANFVLNGLYYWRQGDKIPKIYAKAMIACGAELPINCYSGGFLAWRRGEVANKVFDTWRKYWELAGSGRDMPALACAIKKVKPLIFNVGRSPIFAPESKDVNCIIQHNYNGTFFEDFNLPTFQEYKPFDSDPTDFKFVDFEEKADRKEI